MASKRKAADSANPSAGSRSDHHSPSGPQPQGQTIAKRQRVSRACDQCRGAREKCDGIQPLCYPCVSQNRHCTYQANPKKRGVQTGYIRTLELALAWVFEKVPGSEDALDALLTHEGGQGQRLLSGKDSGAANRLHQRWRKSKAHKGIERILSGGESPQPQDKSPASEPASETEEEAYSMSRPFQNTGSLRENFYASQISSRTHQTANPAEHPARTDVDLVRATITPGSIDPRLSTPSSSSRGLTLPSNHWRLLDIYFSYTHCWLPILEKQEIFQASYLYSPDHGLNVSSADPSMGVHAELWSALAVASFQDAASAGQKDKLNININSGNMTPGQIYNTARSMIPTDEGPFQIHHTRALLLLSLVNLGREKPAPAGLFIGMAVRILLGLGYRDDMDARDREQQPQRFNAVFIACFIIDTIVSLRYGKPPHLMAEDMVEAMHISENDLDEWQPWAACDGFGQESDRSRASRNPAYCLSTFNQLYEIFKIVGTDIANRRTKNGRGHGATVGLRQLQQSINLHAPFGSYLLSPDVGSATVPSPYVLKILYLWATMSLDTMSEPPIHLIISVIEQFQKQFGACAVPPILGTCLSSLASHPDFARLHQKERQDIMTLRACYTSIWNATWPTRSTSGQPHDPENTSQISTHNTESALGLSDRLAATFKPTNELPTPGLSYASPGVMADVPSLVGGGLSGPYVFPFYRNPRTLLRPTAAELAQDAINDIQENSIVAHATSVGHVAHAQKQYHPLSHPTWSATTTTGPIDYDALLDDLASIDCTDGVETDPQFMTNLGFAPGCDLAEIYSQDFTHF